MDMLISQMEFAVEITEDLKAANHMTWVQHVNNICASAEEIIREELIYA